MVLAACWEWNMVRLGNRTAVQNHAAGALKLAQCQGHFTKYQTSEGHGSRRSVCKWGSEMAAPAAPGGNETSHQPYCVQAGSLPQKSTDAWVLWCLQGPFPQLTSWHRTVTFFKNQINKRFCLSTGRGGQTGSKQEGAWKKFHNCPLSDSQVRGGGVGILSSFIQETLESEIWGAGIFDTYWSSPPLLHVLRQKL